MKKITTLLIALLIAMSIVSSSSVFADEVTPTPTITTEEVQTEETTSEIETSEETEPTIVLSEEATAFIQNVNNAENNKENILIAAQEYVDAYVASFDAEGEEATATADALIAEKEEAFFNLFDQGALLDAYDALSEEEKNNEEVINAKAILDALVLGIDTIMNTEETTDEPTTYANGVTEGLAGGVPTQIDLSTVDGDIFITTNGLYTGGTASRPIPNFEYDYTGGTLVEVFNSNGYEFVGASANKTILVDPVSKPQATIILNGITMTQNSVKSAIVTTHTETTIILSDNSINDISSNLSNSNALCIEKNGLDGKLTIKTNDINNAGTLNVSANAIHTGALSSLTTASTVAGNFPRTAVEGSFSHLFIESGIINANATSSHSSAIGAGCSGNAEASRGKIATDINISGGIVTASGGEDAAGIGGGLAVPVDGIYISGGAQVTAYGGKDSPGIGSGGGASYRPANDFNVSNIEISGGLTHVWAYGDSASNMPGIGCGKKAGAVVTAGTLTNVVAKPDVPNWATYIKYGTSATNFAYTTDADVNGAGESLATPISADREFASFLQAKVLVNVNVYYTEVYFGLPHDELGSTDKADIGANNYGTCTGSFNWADTTAAKTQLLSLAKVSGHDQNGTLLTEAMILANINDGGAKQVAFEAQIQAIFNANTNKDTGNYPLTFTYNYTDADDNQPREMSVTIYFQFRDACNPTSGGSAPVIAASNAVHPTGGAAFTKAQLIGLTEGTASNYLGLDADLINDITLTQADVDKINAAKTSNKTGIFPLTYTYVTTTDGVTPTTLTKTVYVTLTDTGTQFTPKDPNHPEKGQNMGPQIGANDYITKTGGAAFDTTILKKMQNVSAKDSNGTSVPLDKLIPDPTQLAAINAAKVAGQVGDFTLKYTFEDTDGTIREVETTVSLRDNEGPTPTPVEKKDENNKVIGYVINTPELGSNDHTTPTGGTGWTEDEIKDLLDVIGKDSNGVEIPRTDFTVDATQLATLNDEKLAGKCGRYPITFTAPTGETSISYVTLNGCVVPTPGPWLVTYVDCKGNTVKVEWVGDGYNSTKPNANYSDVNNVHFHYTAYPNNCGVYRVPNTGVKDYSWIYYVVGGITLLGAIFLINKTKKKA